MELKDVEFEFADLKPVELKLSIMGKKYVLREASCAAQCAYEGERSRGTKYDTDGKAVTLPNLADSEPVLIAHCLFRADEDGDLPVDANGVPVASFLVPVSTIRTWPYRVTAWLADKIKEITPQLRGIETREMLNLQLKRITRQLADLDAQE